MARACRPDGSDTNTTSSNQGGEIYVRNRQFVKPFSSLFSSLLSLFSAFLNSLCKN